MADEETQHEAEHKAEALHNLLWHGAIWARLVEDELARHDEARVSAVEEPDRETVERLHGTALVLVVAIDQVLAFEHRVRRLTGDAELAEARARFDRVGPDAETLRDLVAHLDEYAVGEGMRQTGHRTPPLSEKYPSLLIHFSESGSTHLTLGDRYLNLHSAASAAVELAQVVERVGVKHLTLASQEANAAT
jgi:hypothetical protein